MLSSLRQSASVPKLPMHLILAAVAIQPCVVLAQSQSSDSYYYYWLTPGRIVGIAIGGLVLILLFISLLVLARRRCRHRRSRSRVAPSSSFTSGAVPVGTAARPPPTYPAWTGPPAVQQPIHTTTPFGGPGSWYGSGPGAASSSGWYYPSSYPSPVPPYGQPKPINPPPPSSGSADLSAQPGRTPSAISSHQGQGIPPPDRPAPSVRMHEQDQEQGAAPLPPPPRRHRPSHVASAPSPGADREESPPPYSPTGPPPPPDAPAAR